MAWFFEACEIFALPLALLECDDGGGVWLAVDVYLANRLLGILKLGIGAPVIAELMMMFLASLGVATSNKLVV